MQLFSFPKKTGEQGEYRGLPSHQDTKENYTEDQKRDTTTQDKKYLYAG